MKSGSLLCLFGYCIRSRIVEDIRKLKLLETKRYWYEMQKIRLVINLYLKIMSSFGDRKVAIILWDQIHVHRINWLCFSVSLIIIMCIINTVPFLGSIHTHFFSHQSWVTYLVVYHAVHQLCAASKIFFNKIWK